MMEDFPWFVFDLDGTIADCSHRVHLAQAQQWDEFHSLARMDLVHEETLQVLSCVADKFNVMILTGRNERYRATTMSWLERKSIYPDAILMRPDDNWTSDSILKPKMLVDYFEGSLELALSQVCAIFDDRDGVVESFRNAGFKCWQVRNGAY